MVNLESLEEIILYWVTGYDFYGCITVSTYTNH